MTLKPDKDWWKHLFDEIYLMTDARSVCDETVTRKETDLYLAMVPTEKKSAILDLCGGHGRHSLELCRRGYRDITVLDYSPRLIEHGRAAARKAGAGINFVIGDARNTGLPDEGFDRVFILGNSLGYLPGEKSDLRILRESFRVMKKGGRILIDTVSGENLDSRFNASAWHEIGPDIVVCRQRERSGPAISTREIVIDKKKGLLRDAVYRIRIYIPEMLAQLMARAGFTDITAHRDFSPFCGKKDYGLMDNRMIMTGVKG